MLLNLSVSARAYPHVRMWACVAGRAKRPTTARFVYACRKVMRKVSTAAACFSSDPAGGNVRPASRTAATVAKHVLW